MRGHHLIRVAIAGAAGAGSAWLHDRVPDPMPIHWGLDGRPDGWAPRALGLVLLPALALAIPTVIAWLAGRDASLDPRTRSALEVTMTSLAAFLALVHGLVLDASLADDQVIAMGAIASLLGALIAAIGSQMPRTSPNRWIGVRTPSTMKSEAVWRVVHRITGRAFVVGGALAMIGAGMLAPAHAILFAIACVVGSSVASAIVSWAVARSRPS